MQQNLFEDVVAEVIENIYLNKHKRSEVEP